MKLYVLFGQRKERYSGEYGVEALACMSYYDYDTNAEWLHDQKRNYDETKEFESTSIITMNVDESAIMDIMRPQSKSIDAVVVSKP